MAWEYHCIETPKGAAFTTMSETLKPDDLEQIERKKEKCNMRPELAFVERHLTQYLSNVQRFLEGEKGDLSYALAEGITFVNVPQGDLQITPQDVQALISRLSPDLTQLSHLKTVDYAHQGKVAIPNFDEKGNLDKEKPCSGVIPIDEYESGDFKQRMLIGSTSTDGERITMTAIPPSVSDNLLAKRLYQLHVFLHEYFHTIELPLRSEELSRKVRLLTEPGRTLADWAGEYWRTLAVEKQLTSMYAEVYRDEIYTPDGYVNAKTTSPYHFAVREDMAEAFVASHFDIISNPYGYTSFQTYPFGNPDTAQTLRDHGVASNRAALMEELRTAKILVEA